MNIGTRFQTVRVIAAAAIVATLIYAGLANQRNADAVAGVERALELGRNLERLTVAILDEESSVRAYQISGDRKFLAEVGSTRAVYESALRRIQELSRPEPSQAERSQRLARLGADKHAWMRDQVELCAQGKLEAATARVRSGQGEVLMAELQQVVSAMNDEGKMPRARGGRRTPGSPCSSCS